jgi:hypothetical protein
VWCRVSGRTAATHGDAGEAKLIADRSGRDAQLRTDLAQGPTLGIQVGCTVNIRPGLQVAPPCSC